jgi:hypothetical protein
MYTRRPDSQVEMRLLALSYCEGLVRVLTAETELSHPETWPAFGAVLWPNLRLSSQGETEAFTNIELWIEIVR